MEQGLCSGESTCLPPMWPRFDSQTQRHMLVQCIVGSHPCSDSFSPGSLGFLPPEKSTPLNSDSNWKCQVNSHLFFVFLET